MSTTGSVTVTATTVTWTNTSPHSPIDGILAGTQVVNQPSTGYFAGAAGGQIGGTAIYVPESGVGGPVIAAQKDLSLSPGTPGYITADPGVPVAPGTGVRYLSFFEDSNPTAPNTANPEYSDLTFELTMVNQPTSVLGNCTLGVYLGGQSCVAGAFLLTQNVDAVTGVQSVTISLNMDGIWHDPSLGLNAPGHVAYTTQLNDAAHDTIAEVGGILITGGSISASASGAWTATPTVVPEPATLVLLGTGTAIAALRRRRNAKAQAHS